MQNEKPYNTPDSLIKRLIRKARRSITAYVIKQYYKEFDAEAYNIYYQQQHKEAQRAQIASNFIEFDSESFDKMPTYTK